ncbi:MAG TPA: hypothetical protein PK074_05720 [Spirochaetales bacterium]|nr:hypothetical protein [Spirochaetales bacterium]HQK34203.1 hypothetical protein [Spirochaetales bacterium]
MKRIIVSIMVSLAAVVIFAQNQPLNPVAIASMNDLFIQKPFWAIELSGGFGYRIETYWVPIVQNGSLTDATPLIGVDVTAKPYFYSIPRIKTGFSNLYLSAAFYLDVNNNSAIMPTLGTTEPGFFNQTPHEAGKFAEIGMTFVCQKPLPIITNSI